MNDDEFLGYMSLHCRTERGLFSRQHVERLAKLANVSFEIPRYMDFIQLSSDTVDPLVEKARELLEAGTL